MNPNAKSSHGRNERNGTELRQRHRMLVPHPKHDGNRLCRLCCCTVCLCTFGQSYELALTVVITFISKAERRQQRKKRQEQQGLGELESSSNFVSSGVARSLNTYTWQGARKGLRCLGVSPGVIAPKPERTAGVQSPSACSKAHLCTLELMSFIIQSLRKLTDLLTYLALR